MSADVRVGLFLLVLIVALVVLSMVPPRGPR